VIIFAFDIHEKSFITMQDALRLQPLGASPNGGSASAPPLRAQPPDPHSLPLPPNHGYATDENRGTVRKFLTEDRIVTAPLCAGV